MSAGTPLDDDGPAALAGRHRRLGARAGRGLGGVVSCSALKRAYRDRLRAAAPGVFFLHLTGDRALIEGRMAHRQGHFMPHSAARLAVRHAASRCSRTRRASRSTSSGGPEEITERAVAALRRTQPCGRVP